MTRKEKSNGHKTETPDVSHIRNVEVTHETSDINVRGVLWFVLVLTIATIVISLGMWQLFRYYEAQQAKEPQPGPMALKPEERLPPEPRLQSAPGFELTLEDGRKVSLERREPQAEYRELHRQWEENLQSGLKDSNGNVVGIPIDKAIDKVVADSYNPNSSVAPLKLNEYAITMPTAASSGRETEKKLQ